MGSEQHAAGRPVQQRQQRYVSHALVEVRRFKSLPLFCHSAVLLDMSLGGFKLEFTSEIKVAPGSQYWLNIPLTPLGIYAPTRLVCKCEVRWFDHDRYRIGGIFLDLSKTEQMVVEQVIASLKARGQL